MIDFLIVGGGLAGCNMSYNLIKSGQSVVMIDDNTNAASDIGAGIFNPLLPKHHKIAYHAEDIYPGLCEYYKTFETWLGDKILFEHPINYILPSNSEQNDWSALAYSSHLDYWVEVRTEKINSNFRAPHGYLKIKHSGWVDSKKLTALCKEKLRLQDAFINEKFDYDLLQINAGNVQYKDVSAKHIIFCEGNHIVNNSINQNIQLKPAKGELLIIKTDFTVDYIASQGVFMLPLGDGLYKVGSNFSWDPLDNAPTEVGKQEILSKLAVFFKGDYEIVDHYAGVRPSSMDRRPILGKMKPHDHCYIFNGLGSKGVALAPYYSQMLIDHILSGAIIDREVDSQRLK